MAKDKLEGMVPKSAEVKRLCTGFQFAEGPVWDRREEGLLFSDIQFKNELPGNRIMRWSPSRGLEVFREPSGNSNGLAFDEEGNLIVCEMENRCISSIGPDGVRRVLVDRFNGRRFNAPNDLVVGYDGTIYFTDPEYGIYIGDREIPQQGLYRFHPSDGRLEMLAEYFVQPNGLAFSPNNRHLYVIDSARALYHIRFFDVDETGGITGGRVIAHVPGNDGMKVDRNGNLYVAGSEGVYVLSPSGEHLGIIPVPERPSNLAWGDNDWRTLYITARSALYKIRLVSQGVPTF
ncbi:MAG: SMP-30/gluconolactonase/LRE family protein [Candidatus Bathyarchaeota archaeon]|nr:SMP-30/gluconolactonase/LRE family protein [Candidatus Bathyarchaeota archaeon]